MIQENGGWRKVVHVSRVPYRNANVSIERTFNNAAAVLTFPWLDPPQPLSYVNLASCQACVNDFAAARWYIADSEDTALALTFLQQLGAVKEVTSGSFIDMIREITFGLTANISR